MALNFKLLSPRRVLAPPRNRSGTLSLLGFFLLKKGTDGKKSEREGYSVVVQVLHKLRKWGNKMQQRTRARESLVFDLSRAAGKRRRGENKRWLSFSTDFQSSANINIAKLFLPLLLVANFVRRPHPRSSFQFRLVVWASSALKLLLFSVIMGLSFQVIASLFVFVHHQSLADPAADIAAIKGMLTSIFKGYKDEMEVHKTQWPKKSSDWEAISSTSRPSGVLWTRPTLAWSPWSGS